MNLDEFQWPNKPPTLKEFSEALTTHIKDGIDVSLDAKAKESYHGVFTPAKITVAVIGKDGETDWTSYRIIGFEIDRLMGCGCGVRLAIVLTDLLLPEEQGK